MKKGPSGGAEGDTSIALLCVQRGSRKISPRKGDGNLGSSWRADSSRVSANCKSRTLFVLMSEHPDKYHESSDLTEDHSRSSSEWRRRYLNLFDTSIYFGIYICRDEIGDACADHGMRLNRPSLQSRLRQTAD